MSTAFFLEGKHYHGTTSACTPSVLKTRHRWMDLVFFFWWHFSNSCSLFVQNISIRNQEKHILILCVCCVLKYMFALFQRHIIFVIQTSKHSKYVFLYIKKLFFSSLNLHVLYFLKIYVSISIYIYIYIYVFNIYFFKYIYLNIFFHFIYSLVSPAGLLWACWFLYRLG